jgi:hypothetical protein
VSLPDESDQNKIAKEGRRKAQDFFPEPSGEGDSLSQKK